MAPKVCNSSATAARHNRLLYTSVMDRLRFRVLLAAVLLGTISACGGVPEKADFLDQVLEIKPPRDDAERTYMLGWYGCFYDLAEGNDEQINGLLDALRNEQLDPDLKASISKLLGECITQARAETGTTTTTTVASSTTTAVLSSSTTLAPG